MPDTPFGPIGSWSSTYLTKFLNDWLRRNPLPAQDQLTISKLTVSGSLTVDGDVSWSGGLPSGAITQYAGAAAPSGWLICNGAAVSRETYGALFGAIGTTYGVGNGSTTFNLPDLRGRVPVGKNTGTFSALGGTGGQETHALTTAEIPTHTHGVSGTTATENAAHSHSGSTSTESANHNHAITDRGAGYDVMYRSTFTQSGSSIVVTDINGLTGATGGTVANGNTGLEQQAHAHSFSTGTESANHAHTFSATSDGGTGGNGAHNILQPYLTVNHIIKT